MRFNYDGGRAGGDVSMDTHPGKDSTAAMRNALVMLPFLLLLAACSIPVPGLVVSESAATAFPQGSALAAPSRPTGAPELTLSGTSASAEAGGGQPEATADLTRVPMPTAVTPSLAATLPVTAPTDEPLHPPGTHTGIAEVDAIIDAALGGDVAAVRELIRYTVTACTTADGLGGPPKCEPGERPGTEVTVFPILGSEGAFVRPNSIDTLLPLGAKGLYAVYRVRSGTPGERYWPAGKYGIVFLRKDGSALTLLADEGHIVRIVYGWPAPLSEMIEPYLGDLVLQPPGGMPKAVPSITPSG